MQYHVLKNFISSKMRMSHIYQPVMIKYLLEKKGKAIDKEIAAQLLQYDPSQLEYYQNIANNMVGKVLRNHGVVRKDKQQYFLDGYEVLGNAEIKELITLCEDKIDGYIKKRGDKIWQHRINNRTPVSGTIRYEVLKRASFRCELCGISASEKALEVDHIVPKNTGGIDSINNYQALCYSCNATKRDRDDTDFRGLANTYNKRENNCIFCKVQKSRILTENNLCYVITDNFPVTTGHSLVIPKKHSNDYFELTQPELNAMNQLVIEIKQFLKKKDESISGFNIGFNCGASAGQTIMHTHMHIIPRRVEDIANPVGGIRNIIPGKGDYL